MLYRHLLVVRFGLVNFVAAALLAAAYLHGRSCSSGLLR